MATEQEKRDQELLAPFFSRYGVGPDQTREALARESEEYRQLGRGIARNVPLLAGLPMDLGQILLKVDPRTRDLMKDQPWFSEDNVGGGEWFAEKMGLEREGGGLETLGELMGGLANPELMAKSGVMALKGTPFIEKQIERLVRAGKMGKGSEKLERRSLLETMQAFEKQKGVAKRSLEDVGTPWQVGTKEQLTDYMDVADDYINNSRTQLYEGLEDVEGVLYNMRKVVDELEEFGMVPLKGAPGKRDPQILEEGKIYFHNKAHSAGKFDNIDGFTSNPDLGMEIVLGGKDGMADAVIRMNMYPDINNQFGVASLRSHTPVGAQKLINKIKGPVLDRLGIEVHMSPVYFPSWKTERMRTLKDHFGQLDRKAGNTTFTDAYKKQREKAGEFAKKFEKGSQKRLEKWYKANGFEYVSGDSGSMVRRPQPYKQAPKIPKKGLGGLITNYSGGGPVIGTLAGDAITGLDPREALNKIEELYKSGLLSRDEYITRKAEIKMQIKISQDLARQGSRGREVYQLKDNNKQFRVRTKGEVDPERSAKAKAQWYKNWMRRQDLKPLLTKAKIAGGIPSILGTYAATTAYERYPEEEEILAELEAIAEEKDASRRKAIERAWIRNLFGRLANE